MLSPSSSPRRGSTQQTQKTDEERTGSPCRDDTIRPRRALISQGAAASSCRRRSSETGDCGQGAYSAPDRRLARCPLPRKVFCTLRPMSFTSYAQGEREDQGSKRKAAQEKSLGSHFIRSSTLGKDQVYSSWVWVRELTNPSDVEAFSTFYLRPPPCPS